MALKRAGHECMLACEMDETLRQLYERNFGMKPHGDIRALEASQIPDHDILCAGFPCQPFSKAGPQDGLSDPELGDLYKEILKIIRVKHPKYLILENVPNFEYHNDGQTWAHIERLLTREGYDVADEVFSPHHFGIPQIRERVYIVGVHGSLNGFKWPKRSSGGAATSIDDFLDHSPKSTRKIPEQVQRCLAVWQEFLDQIPKEEKVPHPLWSMEFGATYPYENTTPSRMTLRALGRYRGSHGKLLSGVTRREELAYLLPSHALRNQRRFPEWKVEFIKKNRAFYSKHKEWLDKWIPKILEFPSSLQKLEWNCQGEENRTIADYVIQIRPSGVRVKRRTTAPSLVAMTTTQVPIIAWQSRYMTPEECKRLQSMDELKHLPESEAKAYEALGNAINVDVASLVLAALLDGPNGTVPVCQTTLPSGASNSTGGQKS